MVKEAEYALPYEPTDKRMSLLPALMARQFEAIFKIAFRFDALTTEHTAFTAKRFL